MSFMPNDHAARRMNDTTGTAYGGETAAARVIAVDANAVWLEPLQTGSCGACASAALCGAKGIGALANRLEARRFAVENRYGLEVGDTVEVAFAQPNLIRAAAIAYLLPLAFSLLAAGLAHSALSGKDGFTLVAAIIGMIAGFAVTKMAASRLEARGALAARIVRRLGQDVDCSGSGAAFDA